MNIIKRIYNWVSSLPSSKERYYSSELTAHVYSTESDYTWVTKRQMTPEEIAEWEVMDKWTKENNLPQTWKVTIEKD